MRTIILLTLLSLSGCTSTELSLGNDQAKFERFLSKSNVQKYERIITTYPDGRVEEATLIEGAGQNGAEPWAAVMGELVKRIPATVP